MSRENLIARLLALPAQIEAAEGGVLEAEAGRRSLVFEVENQEAALLKAGVVDGKNAECRAAQLRDLTLNQRECLLHLEKHVAAAKAVLRYRQNELAGARAIARLMAGTEG